MSETTAPPQPATTPAEARAAAKAAKAYAKSLRPWYKKKRFLLPAALVALIVIIASTSGGGADDAGSTAGEPATADSGVAESEVAAGEVAASEVAAGIGAPVRDGKFEFVVNGVECGSTSVGDEYFGKQAQGQFCMLDVTVTNIGDEAQYFSGENVVLYNAEGQQYSADTEASIYLDSSSVFEEINPGNTLTGTVVFDIPAGAAPAEVELKDSLFSGGVTVSLA